MSRAMTLVRWAKGYTQAELDSAQHRFGLVFPPDLVALLREKRPVEGHDWTDDVAIRRALERPFNGLLTSAENGRLWWPEWGRRPSDAHAREQVQGEEAEGTHGNGPDYCSCSGAAHRGLRFSRKLATPSSASGE